MSIEDLQADLKANIVEARGLSALSTIGDVANHLNNTLWPFLENVVREQAEMDDALSEMYEQQEDLLDYQTGKELAATIGGAMNLIGHLEQLATAAGDKQTLAAIAEWKIKANESIQLLEDITRPEIQDDEDDVEDDDEGTADDKDGGQ